MPFKIVREGKTEAQKISELNEQNKVLAGKPPKDIIYWALSIAKKPIIPLTLVHFPLHYFMQ